jgi:Tol biopolymer transport system component
MKYRRLKSISVTAIITVAFLGCGKEPTGDGGNGDEPDWEDDIGVMWQLTDLPGHETDPTWSPDGSTIAFAWDVGGPENICLIPATGGTVTILTDTDIIATDPCWSPDGSLIIFDSVVNDYYNFEGQIYVIDANGGQPIPITEGKTYYAFEPCWSPDMSRIAFAATNLYDGFDDSALFTMAFPDGELELLKQGSREGTERLSQPAWSPDGTRILYYYYRDRIIGYCDEVKELCIISPDGSNKRTLLDIYDPQPSWSPDSTKIAYSGDSPDQNEYDDIFTYSLSDGSKKRVTDSTYDVDTPAWSPDGKKIAFANKTDKYGDYDIWIVELNE